ncbi:UDP-glucose 4-epimerase GalE [Phaeovulum sp. NW3]|uniref:UDP-glucose 4-epimerase GalE n=1 Tax=Phaeovulum sp. NW3 TaxID=2934933 RepID=UPI00201FE6FA|nr:UDP-glucose 4-epimerase GalE [Phaeovulum sp. NW3]MCL7466644.1 UDP-glucose 4-epimerase GalE [Phaeovulum sp. NW3]
MTILLTGGAGYIGSHVLLCCLEAGHAVVVLDDFSNGSPEALTRVQGLADGQVTTWHGDIRDAALLERIFARHPIEAVLHFAGLKAVGESVANPLAYYDVNVGGSVTLARAMAAAGVFRLVFSSTAAVYGDQAQMPLTETSALGQPSSPYGCSKLMVEQVLADLCAADPRWSVGVLRYFNPAGAHPSGRIGEDPRGVPANLIPYAMQVAVGRRPELAVFGNDYPTPDGTGMRDYIHVMDLALGHLAAMEHLADHTGHHIWNLGTGRGHSVLEVIRGMERVINRPLPWKLAPRRPGDTAQCWADPARAATDLGWRATRGLDEMLADHWRWQAQNPEGYQS